MTELERLREEAEKQFKLIEVQNQLSVEADKAVSDYIRSKAEAMLLEGVKEYGEMFFDEMGMLTRGGMSDAMKQKTAQ